MRNKLIKFLILFLVSILSFSQESETLVKGEKIILKLVEDDFKDVGLLDSNTFDSGVLGSQPNGGVYGVGRVSGSFNVTPMGGATYSVPIKAPAGVRNITPKFSIVYSSQLNNGIAGIGWSLAGISRISKIPKTKYHDGKDGLINVDGNRYALDGKRLILKSGSYGGDKSVYQTENYSNLKVIGYGKQGNDPSYFVVYYPDGTRVWYGYKGNSKNDLGWSICQRQNPQGNSIIYNYQQDNGLLSIKDIIYGANGKIEFKYDAKRKMQSFVAGKKYVRTHLLKEITSSSNGKIFRRYRFNHERNFTGLFRVTSISEYNQNNEQLTPVMFEYGKPRPNEIVGSKAIDLTLGSKKLDLKDALIIPGDFDGDGSSDLMISKRNKLGKMSRLNFIMKLQEQEDLYGSVAANPFTFKAFDEVFPAKILLDDGKLSSKDAVAIVRGGKPILKSLAKYESDIKFLLYTKSGGNIHGEYSKVWKGAPAYYKNGVGPRNIPRHYLSADFNKDGLTDVIAIEKEHDAISRPSRGGDCYFIDLNRKKKTDVKKIGKIITSKYDVLRTADYNGDGKIDIFHFSDKNLKVYTLNEANKLEVIFQVKDKSIDVKNKPILLGDFNGDGRIDYSIPVKDGSSEWAFRINTGSKDNLYSYTKNIGVKYKKNYIKEYKDGNDGKAEVSYVYSYTALDFNNDGRTDIITNGGTDILATKKFNFKKFDFNSRISYHINAVNGFKRVVNKEAPYNHVSSSSKSLFINVHGVDSKPEHIFIAGSKLYYHRFLNDVRVEMLIKDIDNKSVVTKIDYEKLGFADLEKYNYIYGYHAAYRASAKQKYPYININRSPSFNLVSKVRESCLGVERFKLFKYKGAVSNINFGFVGFEETSKTKWNKTELSNTNLWITNKHNPQLRGAVIETISKLEGDASYLSKVTNTYKTNLSKNKVHSSVLVKSVTDDKLNEIGTQRYLSYDKYNNLTSETTRFDGGGGKEVTYTYANKNANVSGKGYYVGLLTKLVEKNTLSTSFTTTKAYTYSNFLLKEKKVKGNGTPWNITKFEHDRFGNVTKNTLIGNGLSPRIQTFKYDDNGRDVIESTDIEGLKTKYTYDNFGNILTETSPYNQTTTNNYDGWGMLVSSKDYLSNVTSYSYESSPFNGLWLRKIIKSPQGTKVVRYNYLGEVIYTSIESFGGKIRQQEFVYDDLGRKVKESEVYHDSPQKWSRVTYNVYDRVIEKQDFNGNLTRISYDGKTVTVDDEIKTVKKTRDPSGNIVKVEDPGGVIVYMYYGNGTMKSANYGSHEVTTEIDGWGNKIKLVDPSVGTYAYKYNSLGELLTETTPKGTTSYTYDNFGKKKTEVIKGDATDIEVNYSYDNNTKLLNAITGKNKRTKEGFSYAYAYDKYKRLQNTVEVNGKASFGYKVTRDNLGRVQTQTYESKLLATNYSSKVVVNNEYDSYGNLVGIRNGQNNRLLWQLNNINQRGQVEKITLGNGLVKQKGYTASGNLSYILDYQESSGVTALNLDYEFDNKTGNLLSRNNNQLNVTEDFTYDNLNRLTKVTNLQDYRNDSNLYDARGRIMQNSSLGDYMYETPVPYNLSYVQLNNQGDIFYQGHPFQDITYNYNKKPVSISVTGKAKVDFEYGISQKRSHVYYGNNEEDKNKRKFKKHYSSISPVEIEESENGNVKIITYVGGDAYDAPVVNIDQSKSGKAKGVHYLHRDYLGSILAITDQDANVVEQRQFGAWGEIEKFVVGTSHEVAFNYNNTLLNRGYTGHEHFIDVDLVHMNGRMYNSKLRRFLSPDNNIQEPFNTQNYNRFAYCFNNPLKYTDPDGEWAFLIPLAINGAIEVVSNWDTISEEFINNGLGGALGKGVSYFALGAGTKALELYGGPVGAIAASAIGVLARQHLKGEQITIEGFARGFALERFKVGFESHGIGEKLGNKVGKGLSKLSDKLGQSQFIRSFVSNTFNDGIYKVMESTNEADGNLLRGVKDAYSGYSFKDILANVVSAGYGAYEINESIKSLPAPTLMLEAPELPLSCPLLPTAPVPDIQVNRTPIRKRGQKHKQKMLRRLWRKRRGGFENRKR